MFEELADHGQTVIMVTHEADIAAHARRVVVLRDGVIASDDRRAAFAAKRVAKPPSLTRRKPPARRRECEMEPRLSGWGSFVSVPFAPASSVDSLGQPNKSFSTSETVRCSLPMS